MKQFSKDLGNVSLAPKGKWSREQEYERLALVYNACDNLSYVAKTNVPSGIDIENREYWQPMNATGYADNNFINLTTENENGTVTAYESLDEAIATILPINRRAGATLSFYNLNADRLDRQAEFELWQFNSTDLANWENKDYWNNIYYNWNVFAGWYVGADGLKNHVKIPNVGQYAYVGTNLNDALLYQCRTNGTWTNTGTKVRNYISVVVKGNITIGENGNWFSDGEDTGIPATPAVDEQLDNIIIQLQQHATEIDKLQRQDVALKNNIDSNFETINNKVDNIKTAIDNKIDTADANLQNQITSNDTDIATLNTKHESLSRTVQGIAATGGASTSNNVTYNNDASGLNAENAQDAIDEVNSKLIYDVSARNNGAVFESLQSLLSSSNLSTLIPISVRHGGMSIRFVQSSDNKYVQYRLMSDTFNTTPSNWQGVDDVPTAGSYNMVTSSAVLKNSQIVNFVGAGTKFVSNECTKVIKGHTYKLYPILTSWDFGGASGAQIILSIEYTKSDNTKDTLVEIQKRDKTNVNADYTFTIPNDIKDNSGLIIGGRAANGVTVYFIIQDVTYIDSYISKNDSVINDLNSRIVNNYFIGNNNTYVSTQILGLIPNHKYRVYLEKTDWVYSGTPSPSNGFDVFAENNGDITFLAKKQGPGTLNPYYDITTPAEFDSIKVGGRSAAENIIRFFIVDIDYISVINTRLTNLEDNLEERIYDFTNAQNYTPGYAKYKDGSNIAKDNWNYTEAIPCKVNDSITWNFGAKAAVFCILFFDSEDNILTYYTANDNNGTRELTVPANTAYLIASFYDTFKGEINKTPIVNNTTGVPFFIHGSLNLKIDNIKVEEDAKIEKINHDVYGIGNYVEEYCISYRTGNIIKNNDWNLIDEFIPVKEGDSVLYTIGEGTSSVYGMCIYDINKTILTGYAATNKVSGKDYRKAITMPENAAYIRFCYWPTLTGGADNTTPITINGVAIQLQLRTYKGLLLDVQDLKNITNNIPVADDTLGLIGKNYPEQVQVIKNNLNASLWAERFSFLHISDNHGKSFGNAENLLDLCSARFLVNTGDMVADKITDGAENTLALAQTPTKSVYLVLGNHDYHKATSKQQVFETFIQPMNTHNNQSLTKTYWSLDYTDLFNDGAIKCIFLDQNDGVDDATLPTLNPTDLSQNSIMSEEQIRWFVSELQDAATNGKHVCVFIHNRPFNIDYERSIKEFFDYKYTKEGYIYSETFLVNIIDAFISGSSVTFTHNGVDYSFTFSTAGHFVSWFCGHTHFDYCGWIKEHPKQFCTVVCRPFRETTQYGGSFDGTGSRLGVHFNMVTIDPWIKSLSVYRVGEQTTKYGTRREAFQIFYE